MIAFRRRLTIGILAGAAALSSSSALAQLGGRGVPRERTIPSRDQVAREVEGARYRLGRVRLLPRFSLAGGYEDNVFGTSREEAKFSDYTATVHAGARLLLPAGSRAYLRADLHPSYTWYERLDERRALGGVYRAALLVFLNRMAIEAETYASKNLNVFSEETDARAFEKLQGAEARIELEVLRSVSVFGGGEFRRSRYSVIASEPIEFRAGRLDRSDSEAHAGLRYRISESFAVSAQAQLTLSVFARDPQLRDNQSEGYVAGLQFNRPRLFINLAGGYREGRPFNGSSFPGYSTPTGSYFVSFFVARPIELEAFGQRRIVYGAAEGNPFIFETRNGGAVTVRVRRFSLRGFGEYGTNEASGPARSDVPETTRRDKVTIYGGSASVLLFRDLAVRVAGTQRDYVSNIPGRGRSVFYFMTGLSFEGVF